MYALHVLNVSQHCNIYILSRQYNTGIGANSTSITNSLLNPGTTGSTPRAKHALGENLIAATAGSALRIASLTVELHCSHYWAASNSIASGQSSFFFFIFFLTARKFSPRVCAVGAVRQAWWFVGYEPVVNSAKPRSAELRLGLCVASPAPAPSLGGAGAVRMPGAGKKVTASQPDSQTAGSLASPSP